MKILFVGVFSKRWSSNVPIVEELRKRNHYVKKFDCRSIPLKYRKFNYFLYIKFVNSLIKKLNSIHSLPAKIKAIKFNLVGNRGMNQLLLTEVMNNQYDLVIIAKGDTINYKTIHNMSDFSKTFYYFMDPLGIAHRIRAYQYASLCTWSSASTRVMNNLFKKKGAYSTYILEGYDENLFKPGEENKKKEIDVIFVGSLDPVREKYINYLRNNMINVICYGRGWENKPIYLKELVNAYRKSKIILNFPRQDSGFSDRVFQALGTGSFLLSKFCLDLRTTFKKGIHLDWFETPEECLELVKYYLNNNEIRESISNEGQKYVLENFTWKSTVDKILHVVYNG